jgi:hypothetical protein
MKNDAGTRFYKLLLRLLPRPLRLRFGDDMVRLHADLRREEARAGRNPLNLWLRLIADTTSSAITSRKEALGPAPAPALEGPPVTVVRVPPSQRKPLSPDELVVSRRQFLNRAWTLSCLGALGFVGMGSVRRSRWGITRICWLRSGRPPDSNRCSYRRGVSGSPITRAMAAIRCTSRRAQPRRSSKRSIGNASTSGARCRSARRRCSSNAPVTVRSTDCRGST